MNRSRLLHVGSPPVAGALQPSGGAALPLSTINAGDLLTSVNGVIRGTKPGFLQTCYVSVTGDDATGQRGNSALPFATIAAALAASSAGDVILLGPGTFTANVGLIEHRYLVGQGPRVSIISGNLNYDPSSGDDAAILIANLSVTGTFNVRTDNKSAGTSRALLENLAIGGGCNLRGRTGQSDPFDIRNVAWGGNVATVNTMTARFIGCRCSAAFVQFDNANVTCHSCEWPSVYGGAGSRNYRLEACIIAGDLVVDNGTWLTLACTIAGAVMINSPALWISRGTFFAQLLVSGAGYKRVDVQRFQAHVDPASSPTTISIPLAPGDTNYSVVAQQVTSAGGIGSILISNQTGSSFEATPSLVNKETYEFTVFYQA